MNTVIKKTIMINSCARIHNSAATNMCIYVYNRTGQEVGKYELDPEVFGGEVNKQLLHDVVVK